MSIFDDIESVGKWKPTGQLRWAEKIDGKRVLQQEFGVFTSNGNKFYEWREVPVESDYR